MGTQIPVVSRSCLDQFASDNDDDDHYAPRFVMTCLNSAAEMNPFPSLSKTLNASRTSSSESVSRILRAIMAVFGVLCIVGRWNACEWVRRAVGGVREAAAERGGEGSNGGPWRVGMGCAGGRTVREW